MRRGETRRVCGAEGRFKMNMKGRVRLNWIVRSSSTSLSFDSRSRDLVQTTDGRASYAPWATELCERNELQGKGAMRQKECTAENKVWRQLQGMRGTGYDITNNARSAVQNQKVMCKGEGRRRCCDGPLLMPVWARRWVVLFAATAMSRGCRMTVGSAFGDG